MQIWHLASVSFEGREMTVTSLAVATLLIDSRFTSSGANVPENRSPPSDTTFNGDRT